MSQILAYCSLMRLPVVPQGGNTGLVGGSVPVFDELVLSLSGMNKIISIDPVSSCSSGEPWVMSCLHTKMSMLVELKLQT